MARDTPKVADDIGRSGKENRGDENNEKKMLETRTIYKEKRRRWRKGKKGR